MIGLRLCFILLILLPAYAHADETDNTKLSISASMDESNALSHAYMTLLYDPGLSMRSGAENILTVHGGLAWAEDWLIKTRWFSENELWGKSAGMLCRFAKYALFDVSVDWFASVFAHEYFGHGARYREFGVRYAYYHFESPPPYGPGGGEATARIGPGLISQQELIAILAGGIEAHSTIMNQLWSLRWTARREITYREASAFFWSWKIMFSYVQDTEDALAKVVDDNDISNYVRLLNDHAGYSDPDSLLMDIKDLKSSFLISLANPFLYYSLYAMVKTYLWDGNISTGFPMLKIGGIEYLPSFRIGLAPFGLEYHMENFMKVKNRVIWVNFRLGDQTFYKSWGGVGLLIKNFYENERLSFDVRLDMWKQPEIELGDPAISKGGGIGSGFSVRGHYHGIGSQSRIALVLELGYKSTGFLEGYVLDSSPIFMLGLAIRD
jgi:hypothetical protein